MAVLCGMPTMQYSARSAWLYLIGGSLGPPETSMQNGISIASAILQISLGDRRTNRPRYSVGNNRQHLRTLYCDVV